MPVRIQPFADSLVISPTVAVAGYTPTAAAALASASAELGGVVRVVTGTVYGSGTLLSTGRHILTAAHVVDDAILEQTRIYFQAQGGISFVPVSRITLHSGWTKGSNSIDHDLAILELAAEAPVSIPRYDLYTASDEVGQRFMLAGYGVASGDSNGSSPPALRAGENTFDSDDRIFSDHFPSKTSVGRQLIFDYDDGTLAHDAAGAYLGIADLGLGAKEAMLTRGDSGGAVFLRSGGVLAVAGVNSYTSRPNNSLTDVDGESNGSFGEFAAVMRVSSYRPWIDSVTHVERVIMGQTGAHPDRNAVTKTVAEGQLTAFLVEIEAAQQTQTRVHYTTRDGTAKAGEDYFAAQGEIVFDAGQTWCRVYIETVADNVGEGAETFSLVLSHPENARFPDNIPELTAVRTITEMADATLIGVTTFTEVVG